MNEKQLKRLELEADFLFSSRQSAVINLLIKKGIIDEKELVEETTKGMEATIKRAEEYMKRGKN